MGEESTTPVYIGKYDDGKVVFEQLGEFEVIDYDITDVYPDDMTKPMQYIQTIMRDQTITLQGFLSLKGLRQFYKAIGMPSYYITECLFPKKKKRGTARRERKLSRYERKFRAFIKEKYGDHLVGTRATRVFIDDFIPEPSPIPPVSREEYLKKASFSAPWPGPFEGEED